MTNLTPKEIEALQEKHNRLREILMDFGCEEYGDCIVDEISLLFGEKTTLEYYDDDDE